ncbi:MAG: SDR family oxidoreductase [Antricoccus sp.]
MPTKPTALITGASKGIGLAIARELEATHHLLLGGRDEHRLQTVCREFRSASPFTVDLTDEASVDDAAATIGEVETLVHNAGISAKGKIADLCRAQWREIFEINLFAIAQLTSLLLPALRASRGQVIFINSGSGLSTSDSNAMYCGTKFALRAFADVLREEERPHGVRVCSIHPGKVDTDMQRDIATFAGVQYQPELYLQPEHVAQAVRLAISAPHQSTMEMISVRPTFQ